jgi:hypothetical protein
METRTRAPGTGFPHDGKPFGICVRQGPKHDGVQNGEDGGRRTNAEGKRDHHRDSEARLASKLANRESHNRNFIA